MKKLLFSLCALLLMAGCSNQTTTQESTLPTETAAPTASVDTFTSASTNDFYAEAGLTGDDLWTAFDSFQLAPAVATVNPDGSPNVSFVVPGAHTVVDETDYFVFGLAENQTKLNLEANGEGVIMLTGGFGDENGALAGVGARVYFTVVTDADEITKVKAANEKISDESIICKVTDIKSLG
ncbi:MAG: hypothetical protein MR210_07815 [Erysipelotrichaceae bacterium]|nr:hypothetical protein [Erysipelotrichaceae bacterium]MDY5252962.1 hypothetical protein [Erysipelotrichaceae bacterium]